MSKFSIVPPHLAVKSMRDTMASDSYDAALFFYTPTARIMDYYICGPEFYLPRFYQEIQQEPMTSIEMETWYDSVNHVLQVVTHTTFLHDTSGIFYLKVLLSEDSVSGTTDDWGQMNAYAGGMLGEMAGYESLPYYIPASQMEYHQVASMVAPSYYPGLENPFENATLEGVTSTHTFSFELEADMNPANIHVTAEVGESSIGVDNIASSMLSEVVADTTEEVSVAEFVGHRNQVLLFPNPASDELTCDLTLQEATPVVLMIYSQDGTLQRSFNQGMMSGRSKVTIPIEHLATGIYYVRVVANHAIHTRKFVKQ